MCASMNTIIDAYTTNGTHVCILTPLMILLNTSILGNHMVAMSLECNNIIYKDVSLSTYKYSKLGVAI